MPFADPVLDAGQPCLEICEDEMDDGQKPYSQTNTTPGGCMRQPDKHGSPLRAFREIFRNHRFPRRKPPGLSCLACQESPHFVTAAILGSSNTSSVAS